MILRETREGMAQFSQQMAQTMMQVLQNASRAQQADATVTTEGIAEAISAAHMQNPNMHYDGSTDIDGFLERFEAATLSYTEAKKLQFLRASLESHAMDVFKMASRENRESYENLKALLRESFPDSRTPLQRMQQVWSCNKAENDSMSSHYANFKAALRGMKVQSFRQYVEAAWFLQS
jgi:hypothetical protein